MKRLTKEIIDAVSLETGIAPSYIEKDWYLVSVFLFRCIFLIPRWH